MVVLQLQSLLLNIGKRSLRNFVTVAAVTREDQINEFNQFENECNVDAKPQAENTADLSPQTVHRHRRYVGHLVGIRCLEEDPQLNEIRFDQPQRLKNCK